MTIAGLLALCLVSADKPAGVKIETDIEYAKPGAESLKLDLAKPAGKGPFALIVCIHGGGWQGGNKKDMAGTIKMFAENGYVAASVGYRLAPKHKWPAQVHDVKAAVRYLRSQAKKLNVDPDRVGLIGFSAGGHLALMLGLTGPKDGLEGKLGHEKFSTKVQAVVNFFGPTDLRTFKMPEAGEKMMRAMTGGKKGGDDLIKDLCGTAVRKSKVMKELSPVAYIDKDDPAVLTIHGTTDPIVPVSQAKELHAALKKAGVKQKLELMEGKGHGWGGKDLEKTTKLTLEFFAKRLGKK